jgi:hypothetical protein
LLLRKGLELVVILGADVETVGVAVTHSLLLWPAAPRLAALNFFLYGLEAPVEPIPPAGQAKPVIADRAEA